MDNAMAFLTGQTQTQAGNRLKTVADNTRMKFPAVLSQQRDGCGSGKDTRVQLPSQ